MQALPYGMSAYNLLLFKKTNPTRNNPAGFVFGYDYALLITEHYLLS